MRKDANRSLLVWPAAASAAIIAGTWMKETPLSHFFAPKVGSASIEWDAEVAGWGSFEERRRRAETPGLDARDLSSSEISLRPTERTELSSRGPGGACRLNAAAAPPHASRLSAPNIDSHRELAGLVKSTAPVDAADRFSFRETPMIPQSPKAGGGEAAFMKRPKRAVQATWEVASRVWSAAESLGKLAAKHQPELDEAGGSDEGGQLAASKPAGQLQQDLHLPRGNRRSDAETAKAKAEADVRSSQRRLAHNPRGQTGWPAAEKLQRQLRTLVAVAGAPETANQRFVSRRSGLASPTTSLPQVWAGDVRRRLSELAALDGLGVNPAGRLLNELDQLASDGLQLAELESNRPTQLEWLRAGHALARRTAVWKPVYELISNQADGASNVPPADREELLSEIAQLRSELASTGDPDGWNRFLLLDEITALAASQDNAPDQSQSRALTAQRLLSRLEWHGLDPLHREWLDRESVRALRQTISSWNEVSLDYARLLRQVERRESDSIDLAAIDIANSVQALRFSGKPSQVAISKAIDTHYRNANIRLALSGELLQRLLPPVDTQTIPVRGALFGSRIHGYSRVETDLRLQLIPSRDRWAIELQTLGNVHTRSTGRKSVVSMRTSGTSVFGAGTPISVTRDGVAVGESHVVVGGNSRLRGIRTDYDNWPLLGSLIRSIAASRFQELRPATTRYANARIRRQVQNQIDERVDEAAQEATDRVTQTVLGPLAKLRLDPKVVDLETTEERLLSRYRLAGDWQLSAYTPRPRAPSSSLISVQVHQSAINNTLEQLVPREEAESIAELTSRVLELFNQPDVELDEDVPSDVLVRFAPTRPITVEIEDGMLWITFRIVRLSRGDRIDLRRFIVRAAYRPEIEGMQARLVREGHLRISGPRISARERLPARAIFNKVLAADRSFPVTPAKMLGHPAFQKLAVKQLELRDGWIGLAIGPQDAPRIAFQPKE